MRASWELKSSKKQCTYMTSFRKYETMDSINPVSLPSESLKPQRSTPRMRQPVALHGRTMETGLVVSEVSMWPTENEVDRKHEFSVEPLPAPVAPTAQTVRIPSRLASVESLLRRFEATASPSAQPASMANLTATAHANPCTHPMQETMT